MSNEEIGNRINAARKELGLSLEDVAKSADVNKSTMQRYENGKIQNIKLPVIEAIAKRLDVNPAWLLCKTDIKDRVSSETETNDIVSAIQERPDLMELFALAVAADKEDIRKITSVFKEFVKDK